MLKRVCFMILCGVVFSLTGGDAVRAAIPSQQAANPLTIDVQVGFDGYIQSDTWVPITVVASNSGADVAGELRVQIDALASGRTFYTYPIDLPRGSRKQVTFYLADLVTFNNSVLVDFVSGNRTIASQKVRVQSVEPVAFLIGMWSDTPGALASLGKVKPTSGKVSVAMLTEEELPPVAKGWAALDILVIYDADTGKLSQEQRVALHQWIEQGGRLIVVGGISFQRTLSGLGDLTPLNANGTYNVSLEQLSIATGKPFGGQFSSDALIAVGALAEDARILYIQDNVPLVTWRRLGYGRVDFFAADPGLEPLNSWQAMSSLWIQILADGDARPGWAYGFSSQWEPARQAVAAIPGVSLPSVLQLCGFLVVYIILIGPVNYFILWRLKRRELAWVTIPALVILFSGIAYLTGFQLRGSQVILHRLAVVQSWQGSDTARVDALLGVWSPRRAGYDIEIEPGYLARPLPRDFGGALTSVSDTTIEGGQNVMLRHIQVDIGSVQPFVIEGTTSNIPQIEGNLTLVPSEQGLRLTGDLVNTSDVALTHVSLVLAGDVSPLADLPVGGVLHVDTAISGGQAIQSVGNGLDPYPVSSGGNYYYYDPYGIEGDFASQIADSEPYTYNVQQTDDRRRYNLVTSVLTDNGRDGNVYLTGWSGEVPFTTNVLNASFDATDMTLYIIRLKVKAAKPGQTLDTIPPGLTVWQLLENPGGNYYLTPYDLYLDPGNSMVFRFEPIALVPVPPIESVIIHLDSYDKTLQSPVVEIWNFDSGRWDALQTSWGDTRIDDAASFVDASGGVDLRIHTTVNYGTSVSRFDVTLLGE